MAKELKFERKKDPKNSLGLGQGRYKKELSILINNHMATLDQDRRRDILAVLDMPETQVDLKPGHNDTTEVFEIDLSFLPEPIARIVLVEFPKAIGDTKWNSYGIGGCKIKISISIHPARDLAGLTYAADYKYGGP